MRRFRFPLERVRAWRQGQKEIEEMRLRRLYAELRELEARRKNILEETASSRRALLARQVVTSQDFEALEALRGYAADQLRRIDARNTALAPKIGQQTKCLIEAHRSFQLVDSLRDRALIDWTVAHNKEQDELAAELYLAGRTRQKTAGGRRLDHVERIVLP